MERFPIFSIVFSVVRSQGGKPHEGGGRGKRIQARHIYFTGRQWILIIINRTGKTRPISRPVLPTCAYNRRLRRCKRDAAEIMHRLSFVMVIRENSDDRKEGTNPPVCVCIYIWSLGWQLVIIGI